MNHLSPSPRKLHLGHFEFFRQFAQIFASQGEPAANFATRTSGAVDTGGKVATGVNDTGSKYAVGVNNTNDGAP
jgi:hypothetical protein